jgi:RNA polymerase sigma-70 factor (ECF subfamily)
MTGKPADPERLIELARTGSTTALGRLLERYRDYLGVLARAEIGRRLQGKVDASDLVQDTFLEAHRHFARFRGQAEAQLVHWLRRILAANLANLVRRYVGTRGRDVRLERDLAATLDGSALALAQVVADPHSSPSQRVARNEQAALVSQALGRLPADYREVLVLRHLEGLTFPQVAERMGRSLDSVDKLWLRALARLRQAFGEG